MAMEAQSVYSIMREERGEVGRLYPDDGFMLLDTDPDDWIQSANPADCLSVLSLELVDCEVKKINCVSKLSKLQRLSLHFCHGLQELPWNLGDLGSLTYLSLKYCSSMKWLPNSIAKLSNLTALHLKYCNSIKELPANLGDLLPKLSLLDIEFTQIKWLPWSIAKLSKLSLLLLPYHFRLQTLPSHLNDSLVISFEDTYGVRKSWKELKTEIDLYISAEAPHFPSTPAYLHYHGDPRPWIHQKGLYSWVRILDLDFEDYDECADSVSDDSIVHLPMLTHLYIKNGCLRHLPVTLTNITLTHLSLSECVFDCHIESCFDSLANLSTLQSLELLECPELPAHMDLPVSLTHLTLDSEIDRPFPDSYVGTIRKLANLKSLALFSFKYVDLSLVNFNLVKLKLWNCPIKSLPAGLQHLEIIHSSYFCVDTCDLDDELYLFNKNLVNLETLSVTCRHIQSIHSIEGLLNLQQLHLKDCFSLRKFPPNMDKLVNLHSINVSGTRIKSLPDSFNNLQNLQRIILPKCFAFESLSHNFKKKVTVIKDDTHDFYYEDQRYYDSKYDSDEDSNLTSGSIEEDDGDVLQESELKNINELPSLDGTMNSILNATQVYEGSHCSGATDPTGNLSSSQNQEMEILHASSENFNVDVPLALHNVSFTSKTDGQHISNNTPHSFIGGSHFSSRTEPIGDAFTCSRNHENEDLPLPVASDNHSKFHGIQGHHFLNNISQDLADPNGLGEEDDEVVLQESEHEIIHMHASPDRPVNSTPNATQVDEVSENNTQAQPMVMSPSRAANQNFSLQVTTFGKGNVQTFQNIQTDNMQIEQRITSSDSVNPVHDRSNEPKRKRNQKKEISRERLEELMSQGITTEEAAKKLGVGRSTLLRILKEKGMNWPRQKKMKHEDTSTVDPANVTGNDHRISNHEPSLGNVGKNAIPNANEGTSSNAAVQPVGNPSTFVVKATYNGDTVRFDFSLSYSIAQLKVEVSKRLNLEVGKFKMKYQDEDDVQVLMTHASDLKDALDHASLSKSGKRFIELSIILDK